MSSAATSPAWEPDALAAFGAAVGILEAEAAADLTRYLYDPVLFARECIDWGPDEGLTAYQNEVLAELVEFFREAVRGPHGLGKTTTNAVAVIWFAVTREAAGWDWKVITTAGAWRQLEKYLWPEIHKWVRRIKWEKLGLKPWREGRELLDLALKLDHGEAFAVASDRYELIEGAHADSVLYIYDESKAIPEATFNASEGAFSGARPEGLPEAFGLAQSTPGPPIGRFYDIHVRKPGLEDWHTRHVTVDEAIAAGRISEEWRAARERQWATTAPAMYHNRVLGEFHPDDEDGVIPLSWLEAAHARWHVWDDAGRPEQPGRRLLGVDVADGGGDLSAIATRQGDVVFDVETLNKTTMELAGIVVARLSRQPHSVAIIDNNGVGSGTFRRVQEQRIGARPFTAQAKTSRRDVTGEFGFYGLRDAAWWNLREMLDPALHPTLALPPDDELTGDLTAPKWRELSGGKIKIEEKSETRKRIGRSTDRGDAVVQVCWLSSGAMNNEQLEAEPIDQAARLAGELAAVPFFNDDDWMGAA
jgi:hypothetical protein